jgi:hypothetical protein
MSDVDINISFSHLSEFMSVIFLLEWETAL